ncbi:MAG: STT3 domain-containing protein, partial [Archaeoglobaceae archaeon]
MQKLAKRVSPLLVVIVAFLIRFQNPGEVLSNPVLFRGFDPYYHMRLAELIVHLGSRPEIDYFLAYPKGASVSIPPLFQYLIAAPGLIFGFKASEVFAVFLPVILGVISTILVYLIARRIIDNYYFAVLSALFFALSPATVQPSILGFTDYHAWVLTLILSATYFALREDYYILLAAVFLTLLSFSWMGAPIYAGVLALSMLIYKEKDMDFLYLSAAFAVPVISVVYNPFMGFAFLLLALFLLGGMYAKKRNITPYYIAGCLALVAIIYFIPSGQLPILKQEFSRLQHGIDFILGRSVTLPIIIEAQSFQLLSIVQNSGYFVFLLAIPGLLFRNLFLRSWFAIALILALFQIRFTDILVLPVSMLASFTVLWLFEKSGYNVYENEENTEVKKKKSKKNKKSKQKKKDESITTGDVAFIGVFIAIILAPSLIFSLNPFDMNEDWVDALLWVRDNTEDVDHLSPEKKPEYSVLSWKEYGNYIFYIAKRPAIVGAGTGDVVGTAKFFTAQNESAGLKFVQRKEVRYVMTSKEMGMGEDYEGGKFGSIMRVVGMEPERMDTNDTTDFYNNSMFYRLHYENATQLEHFEMEKSFDTVKV